MRIQTSHRVFFTACCVGAVLILISWDDGGETGWLTGPLLRLLDYSFLLLLIASVLVWINFRFAAVTALGASLMNCPWCVYLINPNAYRPVYLIYKHVDPRLEWSKSPMPDSFWYSFSHSPQLWLEVLFLLFVAVFSIYLLRAKTFAIAKR